jgi:CDP-diacylglycerol--serine O-phosphatidyltransferase
MFNLISLADLITLTNAIFGFLAILLVFTGELHLAVVFIFLGLLADGLDGYIARYLNTGKIGDYFESLADMLSLSIAPLVLLYATYKDTLLSGDWQVPVVIITLVLSLVCTLIRLSSFSALKNPDFFLGLPTSVSAMFLVVLSMLKPDIMTVITVVLLLAIAMISPLRFPKPGIRLNTATALLILLVILLYGAFDNIMVYIFLTALVLYVIAGPIYLWMQKRT